jgi:hypothetical protein
MLGATKNIHKQKNGPKRAKETLGQIQAADFGLALIHRQKK